MIASRVPCVLLALAAFGSGCLSTAGPARPADVVEKVIDVTVEIALRNDGTRTLAFDVTGTGPSASLMKSGDLAPGDARGFTWHVDKAGNHTVRIAWSTYPLDLPVVGPKGRPSEGGSAAYAFDPIDCPLHGVLHLRTTAATTGPDGPAAVVLYNGMRASAGADGCGPVAPAGP